MIDDLPPLRAVVDRYGIAADRKLGQNFLFDLNITAKIARLGGKLGDDTVVEVGPGPGGLTRALLAAGAKRVIAIERDERCLPALAEISTRYPGRLEILHEDALRFDAAKHLMGEKAQIIANLPYNIGTELLTTWLTSKAWPPFWTQATLMFQKEVADRIVASPAERADYGRLAILANWRAQTEIAFLLPPSAFNPPPKVTSAVVTLVPREKPEPCSLPLLERVAQAAFGQRRKMLRQALKSLGEAEALLASAGIEPTLRAEAVPIKGFIALANALEQRSG
jgi:16S rRNA (adenine1518-N6/adenine1519-N6)-dimethyltransferase